MSASVDEIRWTGPADPAAFAQLCAEIDAPALPHRVGALTERLG